MTNERTYQIIIGVLVLIIVVGGWFAFGRTAGTGATGSTEMSTTTTRGSAGGNSTGGTATQTSTSGGSQASGSASTASAGNDSVSVSDQAAGTSVAVSSVSLSEAGWVAVRDDSGRILGAAWFPAGEKSNVSVPLLRATVKGGRYQVLLYADNGDKQFDFHVDTLLMNASGAVAGTTFTAN